MVPGAGEAGVEAGAATAGADKGNKKWKQPYKPDNTGKIPHLETDIT